MKRLIAILALVPSLVMAAALPVFWDGTNFYSKGGGDGSSTNMLPVVQTNATDVTFAGWRFYAAPGSSYLQPAMGNSYGGIKDTNSMLVLYFSPLLRALYNTNGDAVAGFTDVFRVGPDNGTNVPVYVTLTNLLDLVSQKVATNLTLAINGEVWTLNSNGSFTVASTDDLQTVVNRGNSATNVGALTMAADLNMFSNTIQKVYEIKMIDPNDSGAEEEAPHNFGRGAIGWKNGETYIEGRTVTPLGGYEFDIGFAGAAVYRFYPTWIDWNTMSLSNGNVSGMSGCPSGAVATNDANYLGAKFCLTTNASGYLTPGGTTTVQRVISVSVTNAVGGTITGNTLTNIGLISSAWGLATNALPVMSLAYDPGDLRSVSVLDRGSDYWRYIVRNSAGITTNDLCAYIFPSIVQNQTYVYENWTNTLWTNLLAWYEFAAAPVASNEWVDSSTNGYMAYSADSTNYGLTWSAANGGMVTFSGALTNLASIKADALASSLSSMTGAVAFWIQPYFGGNASGATLDGKTHRLFELARNVTGGSLTTNNVRIAFSDTTDGRYAARASSTNASIGVVAKSMVSYSSNTWMHLVGTWICLETNITVSFYVNGALAQIVSSPYSASEQGSKILDIGTGNRRSKGTQTYFGDIADIKFFDRVLTSNEVYNLLYLPDKATGNYP